MLNFSKFNLINQIIKALNESGYVTPTPIQAEAIPYLLQGRDLLGIAQTGTGKTAAFALPILDRLSRQPRKVSPYCTRVLVLAPTRELAAQIYDNFKIYGKHLSFSYAVIFGGVSERAQIRSMARGVDVLVATPGRLLDLKSRGYVRLDSVEVFTLDEADRMLDMGFIDDIRKIAAALPKQRQTLLFSATMPKNIVTLVEKLLNQPVRIEITPPASTVERVEQKIFHVERNDKSRLLRSILEHKTMERVLVFTRTKQRANRVTDDLAKSSIASAAIHGNKSQAARERALKCFRDGAVRVLVATDIAARGIDVDSITHVINYDLPEEPECYVHRIGRTARAGRAGTAISFCDASERRLLGYIERTIRCKVPVHSTPGITAPNTSPAASTSNARPSHTKESHRKESYRKESSWVKKPQRNRTFQKRRTPKASFNSR